MSVVFDLNEGFVIPSIWFICASFRTLFPLQQSWWNMMMWSP